MTPSLNGLHETAGDRKTMRKGKGKRLQGGVVEKGEHSGLSGISAAKRVSKKGSLKKKGIGNSGGGERKS